MLLSNTEEDHCIPIKIFVNVSLMIRLRLLIDQLLSMHVWFCRASVMDKDAFFPLCVEVNILENWALPPLNCTSFHLTGVYAGFSKEGGIIHGRASEFCLLYNVHKSCLIQILIIQLRGR